MRHIPIKMLVGSHNYNLNTDLVKRVTDKGVNIFPASDKDYKGFVFPTFEELYFGLKYSNQVITDTEDIDVHDIRKLPDLFFKANINFLEVLFSKEIITDNDSLTRSQMKFLNTLFENRNKIAKMNIPYLWNSCGGMHRQKMALLEKGTEGTQHLVDAFGYDTKQALHAYRVLNFFARFEKTDFEDFGYAMKYSEQERDFMLSIKHGYFTLDEYKAFVESYERVVFKPFGEKCRKMKVNEQLKTQLDLWIMQAVKDNFS